MLIVFVQINVDGWMDHHVPPTFQFPQAYERRCEIQTGTGCPLTAGDRGVECRWGMKIGDFFDQYLRHSYCETSVETRVRSIEWCHFQ